MVQIMINFENSFIGHIETVEKEVWDILTIHRSDCCFLFNPWKGLKNCRKVWRRTMNFIVNYQVSFKWQVQFKWKKTLFCTNCEVSPSSSAVHAFEQIIDINNINSIYDISRNKNNTAMFHLLFYGLCINVIIPLNLVLEKGLGVAFFSVWN